MKRRYFSASLSALAAALSFLPGCEDSKAQQGAPPPPVVFVTTVTKSDVPLYIESVATLDGYVNADIRARVKGYLRTQDYKDGSSVKVGQTLFTIEATEYSAALASANATLARARAAQQHNKVQVERYQGLFKTGTVSQQDLDNVTTSVTDADGQVAGAVAARDQAALSLSYTQIHSPIEGVAGVALVRVGNLVGQDGPTLLTTVSQIDPIRVTFPMSESEYVKYPYRSKRLDERDLAWAKKQFARLDTGGTAEGDDPGVDLVLSDGSTYAHHGVVVSVNRQIDASTGTIQIQALVPNPDGDLRPGQYGKVRIRRQDAGNGVLAVPERALISVQGAYSVGVVGAGNKVELRRVDVGPSVRGLRVIQRGLAEGDRIVSEGVQKISDGALVDPRPGPAPSAEPAGGSGSQPVAPAPSGSAVKP